MAGSLLRWTSTVPTPPRPSPSTTSTRAAFSHLTCRCKCPCPGTGRVQGCGFLLASGSSVDTYSGASRADQISLCYTRVTVGRDLRKAQTGGPGDPHWPFRPLLLDLMNSSEVFENEMIVQGDSRFDDGTRNFTTRSLTCSFWGDVEGRNFNL